MSGYLDLIPSTSPSRRSNAYDDLLPGGAPAVPVQPAEDARPASDEAATALGTAVRQLNEEMVASQPARMTMSRRGGVQLAPVELQVQEPPQREAPWTGEVGTGVLPSIRPAAGEVLRSAFNNLRRMANEESIQQREEVINSTPLPGPEGAPQLPHIVRRALERQQAKLEEERAARPAIVQDAEAARQDLAAVTPPDMTTGQKAVFGLGTSAPTTIAGLALTRNPAAAMTIAGGGGVTVQAGSTYGEALEKGASHRNASLAATIDGLIEGLDALPIGIALKPGSAFMKRVGKTSLAESATEGGQGLLQDLRAMAMEHPELTLGEVWENLKVNTLAGGMGGAIYGTVGAAANRGREIPAAMHSKAEEQAVPPVDEPKVAPKSEPAAGAYQDLVPGADLDGRVEPTGVVAPIEDVIAESEELSRRARDIAERNIKVGPAAYSDEEVARVIAQSKREPKTEISQPTPGTWVVKRDGVEIARANLADSGDYLTSVRVEPEFRRQGIGSMLYDRIEQDIGQQLRPSPTFQTPEAVEFWKKRSPRAQPPSEPWEERAEEQAPPASRAVAPEDHEMLRDMAAKAIWFEEGGKGTGAATRFIQDRTGAKSQREMNEEGAGRTSWVGMPEWARGLDANREQITTAVEKAIAGKKLGAKQQRIVNAMLREIDELAAAKQEITAREWEISSRDVTAEGLDPTDRNVVDADLVAKASAIDEGAVESAAIQHQNDDAAFMEAVRKIINDQADQDSKAAGGREANRGAPRVGEEAPGFQLEQQTEAELAARERAAKDAAARKKAEEEAAERKKKADAQVGDFTLTGSDRVADVNPQQGGLNFRGMPVDAKPRRTDTPKFKRWFGKSKVVDDKGAPLVVYHGTGGDIHNFDPAIAKEKAAGNDVFLREGFYFSSDPERASAYAENSGGVANVLPVYLSIENPYVAALGERIPPRAELEARGHDGVIMDLGPDSFAKIEKRAPKPNELEIVAFRPDQIKSAIGNSGAFDPKNHSILGMPAGTAIANAGTVPPASATKVGKDQARPDAIRAAMRALLGAPMNEKGLSKKYLGIYKIKPQAVRIQNRNDLRTAAHEYGHHISNVNRPFRKIMRRHWQELVKVAPPPYLKAALQKFGSVQAAVADRAQRRFLVEEGFAEFIAEYLTDPATIQARVPGFYADFEVWLKANPNYAQALQQLQDMIGAHQALPAAEKILAKVGVFKPTIGARVKSLVSKDTWDVFAQATLNKWHPLQAMVEDLAPSIAPSKNPAIAARLLAGDAAIIEDWITDFTSPFDYAKRLDGKNYGKPLKAILEPVLAEGEQAINNFKAYLIARRANELMKVGKENLLTKEEIADGLKLETPLFKKAAAEVYAYNDRLVEYAVEGGLLSPDVAAKFKQYANYIPFFREPDAEAKGDGRGNPFKRLTGGTQNLRDPIANLIQNTANIVHATNRNAMVAKAVELAAAVPGGGRWIEQVKVPQEAHNIATQRIIEQLEKEGVQVDLSMAQNMAAMQTFFTPSGKGDERTRTIVYKDGGELKAAQINDPVLWKALGNIPPLEMGLIGKILAFPAQTLRAGVVLDPTFMARNFMRDTLSAAVQSKGKFIPVASTAQGIKMMAQQKDAYRLWRAFGGGFSDQFREAEESAAVIQRMAKRGNFSPASIVTPTRWLDALRHVGSFTESGSRVGEFAATYKKGDIDSALQAALNAREVSTDFGMKGGHEVIQVLTRLTPFMNPAIQGLYKTARVLSTGDGKAAAAKAAILGANMALLSIALALMNSDEDWYQRIEEWEKTTYWHFKLGDNVFRIPKPFEYGTLFASMPEAMALRAAGEEDGEDFKKRMLQALGQVFGFRVIPQFATLVAEPWANKSIFTGRKLVPDRQQHLEPGLQANPNTSKTAQSAGELANVSPAVIDNVVRNMFGTIGVHVVTAADKALEQTGAFPPGRERGWQTWPVIKAFVRDPDNANTKQQRDFYEQLEKYRTAVGTVREMKARGEDAKAERYAAQKETEGLGTIRTRPKERDDAKNDADRAEDAARRLAKIRKAVRAIEWDRDMSPADKRAAIKAENEEAQAIVEEQTRLYQAAKKSYARPASEGGQ